MTVASIDADDDLNPLLEIEERVQARAKDLALDMATPDGDAGLRALIDDEIDQWTDDFRRGKRPFDLAGSDALAERAFNDLARYGPLTSLLEDRDVWEIMINAPSAIFVKRHSGTSGYHDEVFHDGDQPSRLILGSRPLGVHDQRERPEDTQHQEHRPAVTRHLTRMTATCLQPG
jgi:pilus assembly protein CpaF